MEREGKGKEEERGQFAAGKTRVAAAAPLHRTGATHNHQTVVRAGAVRERASTYENLSSLFDIFKV